MSIDLNYMCLALILGKEPVFTTAAGFIGHKLKVEHDITIMISEVLCRMTPEELDIDALIRDKYLEKVEDMTFNETLVKSSILGYRIT